MNDIDFDDLAPDEKLFALAKRRGDDRSSILGGEHIKVASRMLKIEPDRYGKLLGLMAGWHSLSVFKQRVQKLRTEADANNAKKKADEETEGRLDEARRRGQPVIAMGEPVRVAQDFKAQVRPNLIFWNGEFLDYEVNAYFALEEKGVRAAVQHWMASGVNEDDGAPCKPNKHDLDRVMDALSNLTFRPSREAAPPIWFEYDPDVDPDPRTCISARNGILDTKTQRLLPPTPGFFTLNGLDYEYDPQAPEPKLWLAFLEQIWPDAEGGRENKYALQEIMGHLLTAETKYQSIFMLIGETRGGKGVITRVMTALVGKENVLSQSANDFGQNFGLQSLIGKSVMVVPDLRFGRNADHGRIVEKLLTISGEDNQSIPRKFLPNWTGHLPIRITIAANKAPILADQAGALAARFVPLLFTKTFAGREDVNLTDKLLPELPGILNWALEGLRRLEARRDEQGNPAGFVLTKQGRTLLNSIGRQAAPIRSFLAECCDTGPTLKVSKDALFKAFEGWSVERDIYKSYAKSLFARELLEAGGQKIDTSRPREGKERYRVFTGVKLKPEFENYDWEPYDDY